MACAMEETVFSDRKFTISRGNLARLTRRRQYLTRKGNFRPGFLILRRKMALPDPLDAKADEKTTFTADPAEAGEKKTILSSSPKNLTRKSLFLAGPPEKRRENHISRLAFTGISPKKTIPAEDFR